MVLILRNLISLLLAAVFPFSVFTFADAKDYPEVHAISAVLMTDDGEILYEREADRMLPIASTTKLMTALVVIENCDMNESVEILPEYCGVEGSSMYLRAGDRYTVRELLTGLLLVSGNDAALALAGHCSGDAASFAELMNRRAKELGMLNSHFMNPHGLNEAGHYSTARDLALLMREAMRNEEFSKLIAVQKAVVGDQTLYNHNKLLYRYEGCTGGKTGYTEIAGRCLVSCAERENMRLVCVTLNDPDDWNDHAKLYDWGFSQFMTLFLNEENTRYDIPLLGGIVSSAVAVPAEEIKLLVPRDSETQIEPKLPFYVFAPVSAGAEAGLLRVRSGDRMIAEIPLIFSEEYPIQ